MLMFNQWGNRKCKGRAAGQHTSEPNTALQLFYLRQLNLGIWGYKQLVSSGPKLPLAHGKGLILVLVNVKSG